MKKRILSLFFFGIVLCANAQEGLFTASVSSDSVLLGNYIEIKFTLENVAGTTFDAPDFEGFKIVGGPNQSSSFQMVNGTVSQQITYSYYLQPIDIGTYYIEPANIKTEEGFLESLPIEINVYPNPDGIQQEIEQPKSDFHFFDFPKTMPPTPPETPKKPKKKRKIYKM